jgi:hypothetical protein
MSLSLNLSAGLLAIEILLLLICPCPILIRCDSLPCGEHHIKHVVLVVHDGEVNQPVDNKIRVA